MLRFEITEQDHGALPAIDLADDAVVIGSGEAARVRLPSEVARASHIRIDGQTWTLLAESKVGGLVRAAGDRGEPPAATRALPSTAADVGNAGRRTR